MIHIITFASTTLLWFWALQHSARQALYLSAGLALLLGIATELQQATIPGRNTQVWDLTANVLGVGIGYWLARRSARS